MSSSVDHEKHAFPLLIHVFLGSCINLLFTSNIPQHPFCTCFRYFNKSILYKFELNHPIFSCNILVKNGSPEILSVYVREVSLPLASNQGASNPRIRQLISRHERNNPSLLSSKWRWSTFSNHGRADLQGHLSLYRVFVSYHPTSKGLLHGCRWSCSSRENESSRFYGPILKNNSCRSNVADVSDLPKKQRRTRGKPKKRGKLCLLRENLIQTWSRLELDLWFD